MSDEASNGLGLDEEDRLPWLEPAEEYDEDEGVSPVKLLGFIVGGLALLGAIVGGVYWFQNRPADNANDGGQLIAAPIGNYKEPAEEADAKKFAGEGDTSYAASEGVAGDAKIDPSRVPETPVTPTGSAGKGATPKAATAKPSVTAAISDGTKAAPKAAAPVSGGNGMIQLGAYGSESIAKDAWKKLSGRFTYLAPLTMSVQPVEVGDATLYRLRAAAGGSASSICGKLKVAGENCLVVN